MTGDGGWTVSDHEFMDAWLEVRRDLDSEARAGLLTDAEIETRCKALADAYVAVTSVYARHERADFRAKGGPRND